MDGWPAFSVVIPAHNEEAVILRCLEFVPELCPGEADVVVVANGCSDATAALAARVPGVRIVERSEPSKVQALNAGDCIVRAFPRIYLDADIRVAGETLRRLAALLVESPPAVAAPRPVFVTAARPLLVRLFYDTYAALPYLQEAMTGTGLYGLNEAGRARFGAFPALAGDDLYVQRQFRQRERLVLDKSTFEVQVPWTFASLVAVRTRIAAGNAELAATGLPGAGRSTRSTLSQLLRVLSDDLTMLPAAVVYVVVTVMSRFAARRRPAVRWHRDETSRG